MKTFIKYILTVFLAAISLNTLALSLSADNQTNEKIYVHFYSKNSDLSTNTRTLLLQPHETQKVNFSNTSIKEFYMYAGDREGHNCQINASQNLRVSKAGNQLDCAANYA